MRGYAKFGSSWRFRHVEPCTSGSDGAVDEHIASNGIRARAEAVPTPQRWFSSFRSGIPLRTPGRWRGPT